MQEIIDLRSDTVTKPTPGMRRAMAEAEVGDDVHGEDPTVRRLEQRVAELLGKEAALYVTSGTQSNLICIRISTERGDEILIDESGHAYNWEAAGLAVLAGCMTRTVRGDHGILDVSQLEGLIRPNDHHYARTRLVCLENTHNRGGGVIFPIEQSRAIGAWARAHDLRMHLDGARLMNAVVASGVPADRYAADFDTVSVCFSKGLGAPVGSACAGTREDIDRAHRVRKLLGGGMRQAGVIAAGALYALEHHVDRLAEDHAHARLLAEALAEVPCFEVELDYVHTNIIWFRTDPQVCPASEVRERMKAEGVLLSGMGEEWVRAVTHLDVSAAQVKHAADTIRRAMAAVCRG